MSRPPPRLMHLATRKVVAAKLAPTFAEVHHVEVDEALERLERALAGPLWETLLASAWTALSAGSKRLDDEGLLEKIAGCLAKQPQRLGRLAPITPGWSAFLLQLDLDAGLASESARRALDTEEGRRRAREGLDEAGRHLAAELTRK